MRLRGSSGDTPTSRSSARSQMAFADAKVARELRNAAVVERARRDAVRGHVREPRHRVDERATRRELGATSKTRPESGAFGRGRRLEEAAPVGVGHARRTHGTAVDPRRRDANEEEPVESRIARA